MSAGHTPGPWEFRLEAVRTVIFHHGAIGEKAIAVGAGSYPDHIPNARLIAAAPDLLAGAETAARVMDDKMATVTEFIATVQLLRAAIAKATAK